MRDNLLAHWKFETCKSVINWRFATSPHEIASLVIFEPLFVASLNHNNNVCDRSGGRSDKEVY